jgi:hypothetical protein
VSGLSAKSAVGALLLVVAASACYDPAHADAVALLGPEATGVVEGPTHRPGQPCTTCHGGSGPAKLELSVGGTIYAVRGNSAPLPDATVTITGPLLDSKQVPTNSVGNFFIAKDVWDPGFPLSIAINLGAEKRAMVTTIGRDGSCATCHLDIGDSSHMPGVFLRDK